MMNSCFPGALGRRDLPGLIFVTLTLALVTWSGVAGAAATRTTAQARHYAYVANFGGKSVSAYLIDAATGHLKWIGKATTGTVPSSIAVDPSGKYAYVANMNGSVSQYTIDPHGRLKPMSPATVASWEYALSVTVDPLGKYVYVANGSDTISQYIIGPHGRLKPMSPATVATGAKSLSIAVDPSGKYAYVVNYRGNSVSQYTIGSKGRLMPMSPTTVVAGRKPGFVTVDASGKYAYVANESGSVSQYAIGPKGRLSPMSPATVAAGSMPVSITVYPSGKYAYVANFGATNNDDGNLSQYRVGANGTLTPMTPPTVMAGVNPVAIAVAPSGRYAYVANFASDTISQYIIGPHGRLEQMRSATVGTDTNPRSICTTGPSK